MMVLPPILLGAILRLDADSQGITVADRLLRALMADYDLDSVTSESLLQLADRLGLDRDEVRQKAATILVAQSSRRVKNAEPASARTSTQEELPINSAA